MTQQIRRAVTGLRDRLTVAGPSADIGADMSLALPPDEFDVPPEPMGPVAITIRVAAVVVAVVLVLGFLWLLRGLVLNVFLALLFAAGLLGAARRFEKRMSRPAAAISVNVVAIGTVNSDRPSVFTITWATAITTAVRSANIASMVLSRATAGSSMRR